VAPAALQSIAALAQSLSSTFRNEDLARLNAAVARLYGLTHDEFAHVLSTFPLIPVEDRVAALRFFETSGV
jgi:hypothetical protein